MILKTITYLFQMIMFVCWLCRGLYVCLCLLLLIMCAGGACSSFSTIAIWPELPHPKLGKCCPRQFDA
ncbi:hypothetical protein AXF42_Ash002254 [Apostasia shenzhenica]|uniref:Uncharacterized protein n=1 Tax=Apostasia shenzhenica TaxID=1088818 RepID=A0A2I0AN13_9ASPA|nr:hypothetical protein AXF42_Ash002254 [Apostasia shenzhenica]